MENLKIALVVARFNDLITSRLAEGARRTLLKAGVRAEAIQTVEVAGSYETPLAAKWALENPEIDGVVVVGAVIRGATSHYDYVCNTASSGLMNVQLATSKPVGFGILTCENMEQALDRAGGKLGNKGAETAHTVLEMIELKKQMRSQK